MITPGKPMNISESDILKHVSEEQIARRYVENFRYIGKPFISSLRVDKKEDSCRIFKDNTGRLKYKDFADPRIRTQISLFEYVAYKYNETLEESLERIAKDFNIIVSEKDFTDSYSIIDDIERKERERSLSSSLVIKVKKRNWTDVDKSYWQQYYISTDMLERNDVKSISNLWFYRDDKLIFTTELSDKLPSFSYDYYWHEGVFRRKIYRPLVEEKGFKWMSNTDFTIVQNYPNIPKQGDLLFIQSSLKDCMVMENLGYYAIAPNSESTWLTEDYWEKLLKRWSKIVIFGNNDWDKKDNPGLKYAKIHSQRYGVPFIVNPDGEPSDISDYVKKYDMSAGGILVERLIKNI